MSWALLYSMNWNEKAWNKMGRVACNGKTACKEITDEWFLNLINEYKMQNVHYDNSKTVLIIWWHIYDEKLMKNIINVFKKVSNNPIV